MTLKELRRNAQNRLRSRGNIESPEADSDLIIMHVLELTKEQLLTRDMTVPDALAIEVNSYLNRRLSGMPVQYIIGKTEFMSLEFEVNRNTLIPRQDTEVLVEAVISCLEKHSEPVKVLDIGTGSGCIAVSLAHYLNNVFVTAVDISEKALETAKRNAEKHKVSNRVRFETFDVFGVNSGVNSIGSRFGEIDAVVSNPPYIPSDDINELQTEVRDFEPISALDGGKDGLDFYRTIVGRTTLRKGGLMAFEVGIGQADDVANIMYCKGYGNIEIIPDLGGIDRVVLGTYTA